MGAYLHLVPYRNTHSPKNGQRGHGNVVRIDMNKWSLQGRTYAHYKSDLCPSFSNSNPNPNPNPNFNKKSTRPI